MKIQDLLKQAKPCWKYAAMSQFKNGIVTLKNQNLDGTI